MLEQLRGRNLAHVGCTGGLVIGLGVGLLCAIVIIQIVPGAASVNWATLAWFGLTFGLGLAGYIIGGRSSRRLWHNEQDRE